MLCRVTVRVFSPVNVSGFVLYFGCFVCLHVVHLIRFLYYNVCFLIRKRHPLPHSTWLECFSFGQLLVLLP